MTFLCFLLARVHLQVGPTASVRGNNSRVPSGSPALLFSVSQASKGSFLLSEIDEVTKSFHPHDTLERNCLILTMPARLKTEVGFDP